MSFPHKMYELRSRPSVCLSVCLYLILNYGPDFDEIWYWTVYTKNYKAIIILVRIDPLQTIFP